MRQCPICGEQFDELRYQIVVPGLQQAFDSVDCAARAIASRSWQDGREASSMAERAPVGGETSLPSPEQD